MAWLKVQDTSLEAVADAIRVKGGTVSLLEFPDEFVSAIGDISGGGDIVITDTTDVSGGTIRAITTGEVVYPQANKNATPTTSQQIVTPDTGYTHLQQVTVGAIPSQYIIPTGTYSVTSSGTKDVAAYASASVPAGTEGTPTATKGTVSNHAVSVTPSVTNSTGFIAGGTKTGTAVSVSASELVSGSQTITQNGTVDVSTLAQVIVNVAGGGGTGLEYETGTYTTSSNIARATISFSNTHTTTPILVCMADVTGTANTTTNTNHLFCYFDPYRAFGYGYPYSSSGYRYALAYYGYRGTSTSSISTGGVLVQYNSDNTSSTDTSYSRYWATASAFYPYSNSTSRYWRSGRTYKWYAVWKPTT